MKNKAKILIVPALLLLVLGITSTTFALSEKKVTNLFETGGVNIGLAQYTTETGSETTFKEAVNITPGQRVSMIPRITNYAEPCYVRVQIVVNMEKDVNYPILLDNCYGISKNWLRSGDYLYCKKPIEHKESIDVCEGIAIPDEWTNENSSNFEVTIVAEAIQAQNFEPDLSRENPWGSVAIEKSKVEDSYEISTVNKGEEKGIHIVYADGASNFVIDSKNFFEGFKKMMPGDVYSDTMNLKNHGKKEIEVYFKTTYKDSELLKKMHLSIKSKGTSFYDGPLASADLQIYKKILRLNVGESDSIKFTVSMPKELKNAYQEAKDQVTWWFMVKDLEGKAVQTGDTWALWFFSAICYVSGIILLVMYKLRRGRLDNE